MRPYHLPLKTNYLISTAYCLTSMSDITKLEERLAWCEEYIDQLNDALVNVNKRVAELERQNKRLIDEVRALQNMSREPFNPRDEKPPHY